MHYGYYNNPYDHGDGYGYLKTCNTNSFVLIVVLFILLIIVGAALFA